MGQNLPPPEGQAEIDAEAAASLEYFRTHPERRRNRVVAARQARNTDTVATHEESTRHSPRSSADSSESTTDPLAQNLPPPEAQDKAAEEVNLAGRATRLSKRDLDLHRAAVIVGAVIVGVIVLTLIFYLWIRRSRVEGLDK